MLLNNTGFVVASAVGIGESLIGVSMSGEAKMIKKISTATVYGAVGQPQQGETIPLYQLMGIVEGYKMVESPFGPSPRFEGEFLAIAYTEPKRDEVTKKMTVPPEMSSDMYTATKLFMVQPFCDMMVNAVDKAGEKPSLEFKVIVGVNWQAGKGGKKDGYVYYVQPIVQPRTNDAMQRLLAMTMPEPVKAVETVKVAETVKGKGK